MIPALERKNRPGMEPRRQGTAIERVLNIPNISDNFNSLEILPMLPNGLARIDQGGLYELN
jgi:hypothetical protein